MQLRISKPSMYGAATPSRAPVAFRAPPLTRRQTITNSVKKTYNSFDEMIEQSKVPLLIDFYATWCGPCQMLAPALEHLGARMRGKIQVVKINHDKYPELATKYGVHALPTLVLFKDGKPIDRFEGLVTEQLLHDRLMYWLSQ